MDTTERGQEPHKTMRWINNHVSRQQERLEGHVKKQGGWLESHVKRPAGWLERHLDSSQEEEHLDGGDSFEDAHS